MNVIKVGLERLVKGHVPHTHLVLVVKNFVIVKTMHTAILSTVPAFVLQDM